MAMKNVQMSREPDLSFIQSDIRLEEVRPLETKKLALVVNEFLLRTADVLNSFSSNMEQKILEIEDRLDSIETHLFLTEKKLEAIEQTPAGAPDEPVPQLENVAKIQITAPIEAPAASASDVQEVPQPQPPSTAPTPTVVEDSGNSIKISEHPVFSKYFKMLKMGVPEPGVKQKMIQEGVDPELLNDPNKMMVVDKKNETSDSSDSEFSSDE
uniref:WASH complex subunit 3 n=1 Tax=Panagrolaimus sp. JU765 TaxID=591449 RepID=A0AC34QN33_9BILA